MTTPEHTLVGIHCAIACGLQSRFGWGCVVFAAVASNVPDLDGLPMLVDMQRFEHGHRLWGHNFLVILLASLILIALQVRFQWVDKLTSTTRRLLPDESRVDSEQMRLNIPIHILLVVALATQTIHLLCDIVVSGGKGLSDWLVFPFWPFWNHGFVLPLIPWGDVGPTVIMMVGLIAAAKIPSRIRLISAGTLGVLCIYLIGRGAMRGVLPIL